MANYTSTPGEYDVFIEGDLQNDLEACEEYDARVLSALLLPPLYSLVFLVGFVDNVLAVLLLVKYKGLRHLENIYLLNLAVSNLLFLLILPVWAHSASGGGLLGHPTCKVLAGVHSVGLYGEALFGVLLGARAFLQERSGLPGAATARRGLAASAAVWTAVSALAVAELTLYKPPPGGPGGRCTLSRPHFLPTDGTFWKYYLTLKMNVLGLLLPLFVLAFGSVLKAKTLRSRESRCGLVKLPFAVMAVFLLMWAPYNIALFLSTFKERFSLHGCKSSYRLDRATQITRIVAATHCCVNPLLCVLLDKAFRKHLCRLFHLCRDAPVQPREESGRDQATRV